MLNNGRADETGRTIKIPAIPNYCALRLCFVQKSDKPHVIFPRTIQTLLSVSVSPQNPPLRSLLSLFPSFFHCLSDPPSTRPITPNTTRRLSSSVSFSSIPFSLTVFRPPDFGFFWVGLKCRLFRKRERKIERETKRMAGQVVKVKRERLEECMTCPLCNKLLKEATTISLCLHTFCRKCIYEKLSDEEVDYCPVCEIDLGCLPVEKLRPDHNLQDIRAKIFPLKRRKINAPEVTPSIQLPVKRKERSLSSLVVSTPKVPIQIGLTGRRTKAVARRAAALRGCTFAVEEPVKREDSAEDHSLSSSSPESQNKIVRNKMQDSSTAEPSSGQKANKETDNVVMEGKGDLWTPLNCLVEAANRTKTSKSNTQGLAVSKSEPRNFADSELRISESKTEAESRSAPDNQSYIPKTKTKEPEQTKVKNNSNGTSLLGGPVKRRRLRAANRNRAASLSGELSTSAQVILDASGANPKRRNSPIWFSLVASEDGKGDISLPQISACYLRIKDGKMPVSFIQKYLVKKLDLTSEAEVQILCRDQPVLPTLPLQNLVDLWFRTASTSKKVPASVGSSAKDFVMVLSYRRKV